MSALLRTFGTADPLPIATQLVGLAGMAWLVRTVTRRDTR